MVKRFCVGLGVWAWAFLAWVSPPGAAQAQSACENLLDEDGYFGFVPGATFSPTQARRLFGPWRQATDDGLYAWGPASGQHLGGPHELVIQTHRSEDGPVVDVVRVGARFAKRPSLGPACRQPGLAEAQALDPGAVVFDAGPGLIGVSFYQPWARSPKLYFHGGRLAQHAVYTLDAAPPTQVLEDSTRRFRRFLDDWQAAGLEGRMALEGTMPDASYRFTFPALVRSSRAAAYGTLQVLVALPNYLAGEEPQAPHLAYASMLGGPSARALRTGDVVMLDGGVQGVGHARGSLQPCLKVVGLRVEAVYRGGRGFRSHGLWFGLAPRF